MEADPSPGRVIVLNGTSSAGKTTLARLLQDMLPEPFLRAGFDDFLTMLPPRFIGTGPPADEVFLIELVHDENGSHPVWRIGPGGQRLVAGMHRSVAALACAGNDVILDEVLWVPGWLEDAVLALRGLPVLFVQLYVPLEVAEARERARGDRPSGTSADGYDVVYNASTWDLWLDTSVLRPEECASRVIAALGDPSSWHAFAAMSASLPPVQ